MIVLLRRDDYLCRQRRGHQTFSACLLSTNLSGAQVSDHFHRHRRGGNRMVYCLPLHRLLHLRSLGLLVGQDNSRGPLHQPSRYRIFRHLTSRRFDQHCDSDSTNPISLAATNAAMEETCHHLHLPPRKFVSPSTPGINPSKLTQHPQRHRRQHRPNSLDPRNKPIRSIMYVRLHLLQPRKKTH